MRIGSLLSLFPSVLLSPGPGMQKSLVYGVSCFSHVRFCVLDLALPWGYRHFPGMVSQRHPLCSSLQTGLKRSGAWATLRPVIYPCFRLGSVSHRGTVSLSIQSWAQCRPRFPTSWNVSLFASSGGWWEVLCAFSSGHGLLVTHGFPSFDWPQLSPVTGPCRLDPFFFWIPFSSGFWRFCSLGFKIKY